jgi:hypothetical protein
MSDNSFGLWPSGEFTGFPDLAHRTSKHCGVTREYVYLILSQILSIKYLFLRNPHIVCAKGKTLLLSVKRENIFVM